jgi:hypothetical protein
MRLYMIYRHGKDATIAAACEMASFDQFVGGSQHRFRDRKAERLGGLQADDQFKLGCLSRGRLRSLGGSGGRAQSGPKASRELTFRSNH